MGGSRLGSNWPRCPRGGSMLGYKWHRCLLLVSVCIISDLFDFELVPGCVVTDLCAFVVGGNARLFYESFYSGTAWL